MSELPVASEAAPTLLATGFVVDKAGEGTIYPSAGGNSADRRVQAVYWRCLTVLFASARTFNPDLRLVLFTNVEPPVIDGADISALLADLDVETRLLPLTRRLPPGRVQSWGNVLYFFDIVDALAEEAENLRFAIVDSDVVVTQDLAPLFDRIAGADFVSYQVDSEADEDINGLTRIEMAEIASTLYGKAFAKPLVHLGGEIFASSVASWIRYRENFAALFDLAQAGTEPATAVSTEEHIFSIVQAGLDARTVSANDLIRRIWTSPRHNTVQDGDLALPMWHLPAEKRYGFADLFADIRAGRLTPATAPSAFRARAAARFGLPRKSLTKILHDGVRQISAKAGLRK